MIELHKRKNLLFARKRKNEDTVLELVKADSFQVRTENISKFPVFFWDIKESNAPESVPMLWFFYFYTEELPESRLAFSFGGEKQ